MPANPAPGDCFLVTFLPDGVTLPDVAFGEGETLGGLKGQFLAGALLVKEWSPVEIPELEWLSNQDFVYRDEVASTGTQADASAARQLAAAGRRTRVDIDDSPPQLAPEVARQDSFVALTIGPDDEPAAAVRAWLAAQGRFLVASLSQPRLTSADGILARFPPGVAQHLWGFSDTPEDEVWVHTGNVSIEQATEEESGGVRIVTLGVVRELDGPEYRPGVRTPSTGSDVEVGTSEAATGSSGPSEADSIETDPRYPGDQEAGEGDESDVAFVPSDGVSWLRQPAGPSASASAEGGVSDLASRVLTETGGPSYVVVRVPAGVGLRAAVRGWLRRQGGKDVPASRGVPVLAADEVLVELPDGVAWAPSGESGSDEGLVSTAGLEVWRVLPAAPDLVRPLVALRVAGGVRVRSGGEFVGSLGSVAQGFGNADGLTAVWLRTEAESRSLFWATVVGRYARRGWVGVFAHGSGGRIYVGDELVRGEVLTDWLAAHVNAWCQFVICEGGVG